MTIQRFQWWHRTFGFLAALLVVFIAGTGLLLNHSDELGLDEVQLDSDWILGLYGIDAAEDSLSYRVGSRWLSRFGARLYLDDKDTGQRLDQLAGAIALEDFILAAGPDSLLLLTSAGELVERISVLPGVNGTILAAGVIGNAPVLRTAGGAYVGNEDLDAWRWAKEVEVVWTVPGRLPEQILRQIERQHHGAGISLEKLILDVHSGVVLGHMGKYVSDLFAVLILLLSFSGLWVTRLRRRMNLASQTDSYTGK